MKIDLTMLRSHGYKVTLDGDCDDGINLITIEPKDGQAFMSIELRDRVIKSLHEGADLQFSQAMEALDALDKVATDAYIWNLITDR